MVKYPLHRSLASLCPATADTRGTGTRPAAHAGGSGADSNRATTAGIGVLVHGLSIDLRGFFVVSSAGEDSCGCRNARRCRLCDSNPAHTPGQRHLMAGIYMDERRRDHWASTPWFQEP